MRGERGRKESGGRAGERVIGEIVMGGTCTLGVRSGARK